MKVVEYTNLIKARVFHDGKGAYTLNLYNAVKAPNPYVFRGGHDQFVKFLMVIKAKDSRTWPRSVRGERYADIADEIESGKDQIIYIWEHDFMRYVNKQKESVGYRQGKLTEGTYTCRDTEQFVDILKVEYDGFFTVTEGAEGKVVFTSTQGRGFTTVITVDTWGEYVSFSVQRDATFTYSFTSIDISLVDRISCARRALYIYMKPGSRVNGNQVIVAVY